MKKRILSILLLCCMVLTLLPTTVLAADGPMDTIPKYDVSIDVYNRTSDISIKDSRSYYIYSSVPDKLRDTWAWDKKIFIKGDKTAPHVFIDGVNIEMSPSSKGPAIELNKKASAYLYFIGKDSTLQGADGRAAIQKNRSEGQLYVLARTGTTVTCKGGDKAAGIGGSYATRNISNGYYNGDMYGHGVNMHFGSQSNPDYWGGIIAAIGGNGGAGIGGGQGGAGEKLYFYSGTIQATSDRFASGIGGSYEGRGSEIYIYGGTVSAQGGEGGAGIGGGCWKTEQDMNGINAAHDIYISGGTVTAKGGYNGAGIGGGQYVPARNITVTGGVVTATGHYGAAIGGGRWCHGMDITLTDATLNLSTNYRSNGSNAAAVGYGDIVYKPEQLVADPSIATNDRIKVGSKNGKIVMLTANGHALRTDGKPSYFMHLTDFLIPDSDGMIDLSLLTLPYTQNYGWAITDLDMKMMETSCEGNHVYGWKDWNGCHVWGCTRCPARDPLKSGPAPDGEHIPGEWESQEKKCTVCGHKLMKDTTPPVIEGITNGMEYTADDTDDGQPGTISFTVSDPVRDKEVSSGVKSVTINGEEQTVQTGQAYTVSGDIEIKALWKNSVITPTTYTVTVSNDGNGTGTATPSTAAAGTTIILTATPNTGYHLKEWKVISGGVTIKDDKFLMPNDNVEVKAIFEEDAPPVPTEFTITVKTDGNGMASASLAKAAAGTEITLTATPKEGYHFKEWQVESPAGLVITNNQFTMPNDSVEVKAIFEKDAPPAPTEFTVIFDGNGGTPSVGSMTTTDQKLTSLPSASRSGSYSFDGWYTEKSGGTKITTATVFSAKTTVYAHWTYTGGGGGGYNPPVTYYTLRFETGGGSDIPSVREAYNTYIDLTKYVPTWRGHTFIGWYTERSLMNKVSGVYLTKDMTVYAGWRVDENPGTGANPFTDVSEKDWFYSDVMFVYENGLMLGTSKALFSPHGTATRGMMATILWRMEGSPAPKGKNSFTDVEAGKWYADAITWTAENSIFAGYGKDKFGPDDPITREQLAAIFYRYADYKGYDLTVKGNLDKFKDADKITDYAETAMQWAVGSGLVKGKSGNLLDPQGTATRAEIAAMLHRFIEKYELVQGKAPGGLMGWIDPKRLQIPKTGDSSVLGLWGFSLCTSLAGCLALTTWQISRRREEESLQIIEK